MKLEYKKIPLTQVNQFQKLSETKIKTKNQIKEKDLYELVNQTYQNYKDAGYSDEQLRNVVFYRYVVKK